MSVIQCPVCNSLNEATRLICVRCNTSLPTEKTVVVPKPNQTKQFPSIKPAEINYENTMVLHIIGEEEPLILTEPAQQVTIGRSAPGDKPPDVDLAQYGAGILGVSRLHAVITHTDRGYVIEDLDSTNGTYLNNEQLQPHTPYVIHTGDYLCLGQMAFYLHFKVGKTGTQTVYISASQPVTSGHLLQDVAPYLAAVEALQQVINELRGEQLKMVQVKSITPTSSGSAFAVSISGVQEAISLTTQVIQPWKHAHQQELAQHQGMLNGSLPDLVSYCSQQLAFSADKQTQTKLVKPLQQLISSHLHVSYEQPTATTA